MSKSSNKNSAPVALKADKKKLEVRYFENYLLQRQIPRFVCLFFL